MFLVAGLLGNTNLMNRTITVRLPADLGQAFAVLADRLKPIPKSVIVRILLSDPLARPLEDQVDLVLGAIRDGNQDETKKRARIPRNSTRRIGSRGV